MKYLFLDIDDVIALIDQHNYKKKPKIGPYRFDRKCVIALNQITEATGAKIILSSDWRTHYDFETMNEIFEYNGVDQYISDFTIDIWSMRTFESYENLEYCRSLEINSYVDEYLTERDKWVVVDDMDLSPYFEEENFVRTPRMLEGIKQSGIREKIIELLNKTNDL